MMMSASASSKSERTAVVADDDSESEGAIGAEWRNNAIVNGGTARWSMVDGSEDTVPKITQP